MTRRLIRPALQAPLRRPAVGPCGPVAGRGAGPAAGQDGGRHEDRPARGPGSVPGRRGVGLELVRRARAGAGGPVRGLPVPHGPVLLAGRPAGPGAVAGAPAVAGGRAGGGRLGRGAADGRAGRAPAHRRPRRGGRAGDPEPLRAGVRRPHQRDAAGLRDAAVAAACRAPGRARPARLDLAGGVRAAGGVHGRRGERRGHGLAAAGPARAAAVRAVAGHRGPARGAALRGPLGPAGTGGVAVVGRARCAARGLRRELPALHRVARRHLGHQQPGRGLPPDRVLAVVPGHRLRRPAVPLDRHRRDAAVRPAPGGGQLRAARAGRGRVRVDAAQPLRPVPAGAAAGGPGGDGGRVPRGHAAAPHARGGLLPRRAAAVPAHHVQGGAAGGAVAGLPGGPGGGRAAAAACARARPCWPPWEWPWRRRWWPRTGRCSRAR